MTEKKAKPAAKKVATAKAGSALTGKAKTKSKTKTKTKIKVGKTAPAPAAGKPAMKKPAASKAGVATAEAKKAKAPVVKKTAAPVKPTPEERYRMVETAAYFIAERHGFQGRSDEHWAAAEREIAARLDK
jgi:hypothetical protein